MKKYFKMLHKLIGLFFAAIISLTCIINLIVPDQKMSFVENRSLQTFP